MNRKTIPLAEGWKFRLGENEGGWYAGLDDSDWQTARVPHDWAVGLPFAKENSSGTGYVEGGVGWYRRRFSLGDIKGKRVYITFEGVYNNSRVYVNSNYLGKRPYGYATFTHDITDFVREGENVVSVEVRHIQTADSRWYTGSGIVRPVYLTVTDEAAVAFGGVRITTPEVNAERAVLRAEVATTRPGLTVKNTVLAPDGSVAAEGGERLEVARPLLWGPASPSLYSLRTDVYDGGRLADTLVTPFGIRFFRFDPALGFFLNGESMKLKGVCLHHDAGCLGAAVPKSVWRHRLLTLRACGCNAVRTSHNPPDPALLDLCDELGFLVVDEAFDEWEGPKNKWWQGHNVYPPKRFGYFEDFPAWGEEDIKTMVRRDRNHPCVIIWSIGNEIDYPNDPYVHPLFDEVMGNNDAGKPKEERVYDKNRPDASRLAVVAERLVRWVKEEDSTRPVTAALAFPELSNRTGLADKLDIVGYNYKEQLYSADCDRYPERVIYGSENSHSPAAWNAVRDNANICGQFLWTGIDYMGEAHGWPVRASGAGLLDMAGFPKLRYYQRRAMWSGEPAAVVACRLYEPEPDGFDRRRRRFKPFEPRWSFPEGAEVEVMISSNHGGEAELLLNGKAVAAAPIDPAFGAAFARLPFAEGVLTARVGGAEASLATAGEPAEIAIKTFSHAADDDVTRLEITVLDKNGNPVPERADVSVAVEGCDLLGLENGDIADCRPYTDSVRAANMGRLAAYVRGSGRVRVAALGLEAEIEV